MLRRNSTKEISIRQQALLLALARQKGFDSVEDAYQALHEHCLADDHGRRHPSTHVSQFIKAAEERGAENITMADAQRMIPLLKGFGPNVGAFFDFDKALAEVAGGLPVNAHGLRVVADDAVRYVARHRDVADCVVLVAGRDGCLRVATSNPEDSVLGWLPGDYELNERDEVDERDAA